MAVVNRDLDRLADRLRRCYQFERNRLHQLQRRDKAYRVPACWRAGGPEGPRESVWHRLARLCRKRDIDPIRYVQWCLSLDTVLLGWPPEPNQLQSPAWMARFQEYAD